jgi:hypothetical protein
MTFRIRAAVASAAIASAGAAQAQSSPSFQPLVAPAGRYVLGQIDPARADQFLLDTQTGRVWQLACLEPGEGMNPCKRMILQPVLIMQDFVGHELSPYPPATTFMPAKK